MKDQQQQKLDSAMLLYAISFIASETIENLKGTPIYSQRIKQLCNMLQPETDRLINIIMSQCEDLAAQQFYEFIETLESFLNTVSKRELVTVKAMLDQLRNGEIMVIDEKKHSKIVKQLERV